VSLLTTQHSFFDKFANDFAATGNTANRAMLDSGKADLLEWEKVLQAIKDLCAELSSRNLRECDKTNIYAEIDRLSHLDPDRGPIYYSKLRRHLRLFCI
jgi:hypothetical protein